MSLDVFYFSHDFKWSILSIVNTFKDIEILKSNIPLRENNYYIFLQDKIRELDYLNEIRYYLREGYLLGYMDKLEKTYIITSQEIIPLQDDFNFIDDNPLDLWYVDRRAKWAIGQFASYNLNTPSIIVKDRNNRTDYNYRNKVLDFMEDLNELLKEVRMKQYSFKFKDIENTIKYLENKLEELRRELKNKKLYLEIPPVNILHFVTAILIVNPSNSLELWDIIEYIYDVKYTKMFEGYDYNMKKLIFGKKYPSSNVDYKDLINAENIICSYDYLWLQEDIILNYYEYEKTENHLERFINLI